MTESPATTCETPVLNLRDMVVTALDKHLASGAVEKTIAAAVEKTVQGILNDQLKEYSDFGKQLSEGIKAAVKIDGVLGIPGYNDLVLKIIKQNIDGRLEESLQRQLKTQLEDLLETAPAEIKLSALVEQFKEAQDSEDRKSGEIGLFVNDDGHGFIYIGLNQGPCRSEYECDFRIGFHNSECFNLTIGRKDVSEKLFVGPLYGFAKTVFQFYTAKTRLVLDVESSEIDLSYPAIDDEDY